MPPLRRAPLNHAGRSPANFDPAFNPLLPVSSAVAPGVGAWIRRRKRVLDVRIEGIVDALPGSMRRDVRVREIEAIAIQRQRSGGNGERNPSFLLHV